MTVLSPSILGIKPVRPSHPWDPAVGDPGAKTAAATVPGWSLTVQGKPRVRKPRC